jgi:hypothetical protein
VDLREWRDRLVSGDAAARSMLAEYLVNIVCTRLLRQWAMVDRHLVMTAVHDAVLRYLDRPAMYDPDRSLLEPFVTHAAHRRLQTLE